jgi:hypothetical protein
MYGKVQRSTGRNKWEILWDDGTTSEQRSEALALGSRPFPSIELPCQVESDDEIFLDSEDEDFEPDVVPSAASSSTVPKANKPKAPKKTKQEQKVQEAAELEAENNEFASDPDRYKKKLEAHRAYIATLNGQMQVVPVDKLGFVAWVVVDASQVGEEPTEFDGKTCTPLPTKGLKQGVPAVCPGMYRELYLKAEKSANERREAKGLPPYTHEQRVEDTRRNLMWSRNNLLGLC